MARRRLFRQVSHRVARCRRIACAVLAVSGHAFAGEPEPPAAPDLERTISAAVARFGEDRSALEGLPTDLVDCRGYKAPIGDAGDNAAPGVVEWLRDGLYGWDFVHFSAGTCVVVSAGGSSRGLSVGEATAFLEAARAGIDDPAHPSTQRTQNCLAKSLQDFGGNIPAYESGTIKGRRFRVFYAALDPDLAALDKAQHAFVDAEKKRWAKLAVAPARTSDAFVDVEIRIRPTGRTKRLATLEAIESVPGAADPAQAIVRDWMLHVPSGRLIAFEDLFDDPKAVRAHIVAAYLERMPQYLETMMASIAFLGDSADADAQAFRDDYLAKMHRVATAPADHFVQVGIAADGQRAPSVFGQFSRAYLPEYGPAAMWAAGAKELAPYFKPGFRDVLEAKPCPGIPAG